MKPKYPLFLLLAASVAALGGLLFGFDTAVISGTIPFIQPYFNLDDIQLGWTVSSLLAGCIVGVISAGKPKAMSLAVVALWLANFIVILVFPVILYRLGGGMAFLIFDLMCILLILFVVLKFPETKGKSIEELEKILLK